MTELVRFRIVTIDAKIHVGPVQGAGGLIAGRNALGRMLRAVAHAEASRDLVGIYEPEPGYVAMYPEYAAEGSGPEVRINLRGAHVELA